MLLTTRQVSELLQIDVRTVTRWLRTGRLPGDKAGRKWRIALEDLETFLEGAANRPIARTTAIAACEYRVTKALTNDIIGDTERFEVEIRPFEFQPINDESYLKVRTYPRPTDRTVRLGVIEWMQSGSRGARLLINRRPMRHTDAMEYAQRFAEKFEIPVIYQREDDPAV